MNSGLTLRQRTLTKLLENHLTKLEPSMGNDELTPQQRASKKQSEARRNSPRIPSLCITKDESALLDALAGVYGSKKSALIEGLKLLKAQQGHKTAKDETIRAVLNPLEGGYQTQKAVTSLRETAAYYFVRAEGQLSEWQFSKKDMRRVGMFKNQFPRYELVILKDDQA